MNRLNGMLLGLFKLGAFSFTPSLRSCLARGDHHRHVVARHAFAFSIGVCVSLLGRQSVCVARHAPMR